MNQNYWLIILFVATMVCNGDCRPREVDLRDIRPVYRSDRHLETALNSSGVSENRETMNHGGPPFNIESIATVARASSDGPSVRTPTDIGKFVHQMMDSDIRTPPKLKEILKEKNTAEEYKPMPVTFIYEDEESKFHRPGGMVVADASQRKAPSYSNAKVVVNDGNQGIAIPVVMDESEDPTESPKKLQKIAEAVKPVKEDRRKASVTRIHPTTTPSSGLSTWILLSDNRDATTVASPKKTSKKDGNSTASGSGHEEKKKAATVTVAPATKKPAKSQPTTTLKASVAVKKITTKATSGKKPETESTTASSALEAMVKNQKKPSTSTTTVKPKTTEPKGNGQKKQTTDPKKKISEKVDTVDRTEVQTIPPHFVLTTEDPTGGVTEQQATETTVEGTTKKKKTSSKKKKKNKKKTTTKKPETRVEPKIPSSAVGSQIYNFLSREIVPTVGLGLIGVALTAGLASFLGYNPFVSQTVPLRRTYESHHGYTPSNYYNYNTDYSDGGQSEEVLLREVLSGMPEESRYGLTHGESAYSEVYTRKDQNYNGGKTSGYSQATGSTYSSEKDAGSNYDGSYSQDYSSYSPTYDSGEKKYPTDYNEKYPVYTRETGTSFVYPETPVMTPVEKTTRTDSKSVSKNQKTGTDTIERQPEALYRVAGDGELQYGSEAAGGSSSLHGVNGQTNWHRMGTPVESSKPYARLEPGPRSLNLEKVDGQEEVVKKRERRDVRSNIQRIARKRTKKESDAENEVDFEDTPEKVVQVDISEFSKDAETTTTTTTTARTTTTTGKPETSTAEEVKIVEEDEKKDEEEEDTSATELYHPEDDVAGSIGSTASVLDILKRLAQFKLRLGLNFLRSTTDMFSRYLDVIQRKVDESFTNTTTVHYNRQKNPWSRIFYGGREDNHVRRRRSALLENPLLASLLLTEDARHASGRSKSTKKDLKPTDKIFHAKRTVPKKYAAKSRI